jgi:hypothetical protein
MNDFPHLPDVERMRKTRATSKVLCEEGRAACEHSRAVLQEISMTIARCHATLDENNALRQVCVLVQGA